MQYSRKKFVYLISVIEAGEPAHAECSEADSEYDSVGVVAG